MKFKQSVNLLLIALFVWSAQITTIHFKHHLIEDISECQVCDSSNTMQQNEHQPSEISFNKSDAVQTRKHIEKVIVKSRFDYKAVPKPERLYCVEYHQYSVEPIPIGFNALAPPYFIA